jgi:hypothetical protein
MMDRARKLRMTAPAWALLLLAPMVGELLSGSSPPAKFFSPFLFLIQVLLYGSGAVLVRELRIRWNRGWPTVLALGAAYGILEEGLMVKTFFDPTWPGLGEFGTVGRAWGVNWIWSLDLTAYHAVFSITIPIALVELAFPRQARDRWLGPWSRRILAVLLAADVLLGFTLMTPYRPPAPQYLLAALLAAGLFALARRLPASITTHAAGEMPAGAGWVGLTAFLGTVAFFGVSWALPATGLAPWLLAESTGAVLAGTGLALAVLADGGRRWSRRHRFGAAAGALAFLVLLTPLHEFGRGAAGMLAVGLLFALALFALGRSLAHPPPALHQRDGRSQGPPDPTGVTMRDPVE